MKSIGQRMKELRKEAGMSQEELAHDTGISTVSISAIEAGGNFSVETLMKLCDGLRLKLIIIKEDNIYGKF